MHHEVSAHTFARFRQARQALEKEVGHARDDDAFLSLLTDRAIAPGEASTTRRAPHQIAVTICRECKRGWQDGAGRPIEIDGIALEVAECDAERIGALDDPKPKRASQDISPATRRMMLRRGGTGELDNIATVCSEHHRAIHLGLVREVTTEDGELRFEHMNVAPSSAVIETATRALAGLGFSMKEARSFVESALAHVGQPTVEALVKEAHGKPRPAVTSIQFMLPAGAFSAIHRVASSEIWLHLQGDPVKLHTIVDGKHEEIVLKNRQHTVPANAWQAAEPMGADYTLCACIVAPGFDFEDFEMATREALLRDFPKLEELVTRLTL